MLHKDYDSKGSAKKKRKESVVVGLKGLDAETK
jgi:hypothetical protein